MSTERIIDQWIYPMDSSSTPYNDVDFNDDVKKFCEQELEQLNQDSSTSTESNNNNNNNGGRRSSPIKNRLRISKCNVVGDPSVGKTCLINRFGYDIFDSNTKATIGVDFDVQKFSILQRPFTLQIWDTAGDERFRTITRAYYRGAHAALIVFDLSQIKSFQSVQKWFDEIMDAFNNNSNSTNDSNSSGNTTTTTSEQQQQQHRNSIISINNSIDRRPFIFLIGTKKDLISEDTIDFYRKEGGKLSEKLQAEFWMVSSETGENVNDLFNRIACLCFNNYLKKELLNEKLQREQQLQQQQITNNSNSDSKSSTNQKRSVRYSAKNGGQVTFHEEEEQEQDKVAAIEKSKLFSRKNSKSKIISGSSGSGGSGNNNSSNKNYRPSTTTILNNIWHQFVDICQQWFGQQGKIPKRIRRIKNNNKVQSSTSGNPTSDLNSNQKKNKKFQCFNYTCMCSSGNAE